MPKLPNPPKSKRLTKKVGLECLSILNELDRVLFDSRILERPSLWKALLAATDGRAGGPDSWISEMHNRIIDARANLNVWKDAEAEDKRSLRREEYATEYVTVVDEEGDSYCMPRYRLNPKLRKNCPWLKKDPPLAERAALSRHWPAGE